MSPDDPKAVVARFNDFINARDVRGLTGLMAEDHVFIDSAGHRIVGVEACREAWEMFFAAFPDYRNELRRLEVRGEQVAVTGRSVCSDPRLEGPALWAARIVDGKVSEWRVHEDTESNRELLGLSGASGP